MLRRCCRLVLRLNVRHIHTDRKSQFEAALKRVCETKIPPIKTDLEDEFQTRMPLTGDEIFANADTSLNYVSTYGFDYDYTLAVYNDNLLEDIYKDAAAGLVAKGYPAELLKKTFDKDFAIRGLRLDRRTGYLFKLDQFQMIQPGTVYYGRTPVDAPTFVSIYGGMRISPVYSQRYLRMIADHFSLPEATLYADVIQCLEDNKLEVFPHHVYADVRVCFELLHVSGSMHHKIAQDPARYIKESPRLLHYLKWLREAQKKIFLLTNSPFHFVDIGMKYMLRKDLSPDEVSHWPHLFDVVICSAGKPDWFGRSTTFRALDHINLHGPEKHIFGKVNRFVRGRVYTGGSLVEFKRLTATAALPEHEGNCLYMGDHIFSDLSQPNQHSNWKTAALLPEIAIEATTTTSQVFRENVWFLNQVDRLIMFGQGLSDADSQFKVEQLKKQRKELRRLLKEPVNQYFGSVFRTTSHRTEFFFEVLRTADLYTASIHSFLGYPLDWCFYSARKQFVHERNDEVLFNPRPPLL